MSFSQTLRTDASRGFIEGYHLRLPKKILPFKDFSCTYTRDRVSGVLNTPTALVYIMYMCIYIEGASEKGEKERTRQPYNLPS